MTHAETDPLAGILDGLQAGFEGALRGSRLAVGHPGARGEASEDGWLQVLRAHLPHRYRADRAFVVDSQGACSDQIDVVIYDRQYSPLLFNDANQRFVPAESVYAVLEVKQDLTREHILYAGQKAASVRRLHRTSAPVPHVEGVAQARTPPPILAGILTYQSAWNPPFGEPLRQVLSELDAAEALSIGCALVHGVFEAGRLGNGVEELAAYESSRALLQLILRLLRQLQALATAPAIDYEAYLARISTQSNSTVRSVAPA